MRATLAFLTLAFALPVAVQAQDTVAWQRFWPHAVGDEWQYNRYYQCFLGTPSCGNVVPLGTERYAVVGDTLVGGTTFAVYSGEIRSTSGTVSRQGRCAAGVVPGDLWFTVLPVPGYEQVCPFRNIAASTITCCYRFAVDRPVDPVTVTVGTQPYTAAATANGGNAYGQFIYQFAADLGVYRMRSDRGSGSHSESDTWTLQYARVGGVEYGTAVVVAMESPPLVSDLILAPNPAGDAAVLTLSVARAGALSVEVVDVLGRIVLARDLGAASVGVSTHRLDTSGLAPGTYVLRVVTPDGVVTRRFTRGR